jgi:hypothetical protein
VFICAHCLGSLVLQTDLSLFFFFLPISLKFIWSWYVKLLLFLWHPHTKISLKHNYSSIWLQVSWQSITLEFFGTWNMAVFRAEIIFIIQNWEWDGFLISIVVIKWFLWNVYRYKGVQQTAIHWLYVNSECIKINICVSASSYAFIYAPSGGKCSKSWLDKRTFRSY